MGMPQAQQLGMALLQPTCLQHSNAQEAEQAQAGEQAALAAEAELVGCQRQQRDAAEQQIGVESPASTNRPVLLSAIR